MDCAYFIVCGESISFASIPCPAMLQVSWWKRPTMRVTWPTKRATWPTKRATWPTKGATWPTKRTATRGRGEKRHEVSKQGDQAKASNKQRDQPREQRDQLNNYTRRATSRQGKQRDWPNSNVTDQVSTDASEVGNDTRQALIWGKQGEYASNVTYQATNESNQVGNETKITTRQR